MGASVSVDNWLHKKDDCENQEAQHDNRPRGKQHHCANLEPPRQRQACADNADHCRHDRHSSQDSASRITETPKTIALLRHDNLQGLMDDRQGDGDRQKSKQRLLPTATSLVD